MASIEEGAFSGCCGLTSIEIPDSVTYIGKYAFSDCCGLTSIKIPDRITSIGEEGIDGLFFEGCGYAFSGCSGLTSIEIPDSVTYIGKTAFRGCTNLKEVHLRNEYPENIGIDEDAFYGISECTLFVPIGTGYAYRHDERFKVFKEVKIER